MIGHPILMVPSIEIEAAPGFDGRPTRPLAKRATRPGHFGDLLMPGTVKSLATTVPLKPFASEPVNVLPVSAPLLPVVSVGAIGPMSHLKPSRLADAVMLAVRLMSALVNPAPILAGPVIGPLTVMLAGRLKKRILTLTGAKLMSAGCTVEMNCPLTMLMDPQACAARPEPVALPNFIEPLLNDAWKVAKAVGGLVQVVALASAGLAPSTPKSKVLARRTAAGAPYLRRDARRHRAWIMR